MDNENVVNATQGEVVASQNEQVEPTVADSETKAVEVAEQPKEQKVEQTKEENAAFKQMRLRQQELEAKLKKYEEVAKLYNYESEDEFADVLKSNFERQQIDTLVNNGMTEEEAKKRIELEKEVERLKRFEVEYETEQQKNRQNLEFLDYFREVHGRNFSDADRIPAEVLEAQERGTPLKYAYADYLAREAVKRASIEKVNMENAETSAGSATGEGAVDPGFISEAQYEKMSQAEVDKNYDLIIKSMKRWT